MKVIAYDKFPRRKLRHRICLFDTLFAESDIISLHCPLTKETYHLIDGDAIAK